METKQLQGLYEAYLQVYSQDEYISEEVDVAAQYFYDLGLNQTGVEYVIEEVGVDDFVEFVYDLFEEHTLTEARRSGRIEPVTKTGKSIGSLKGGAKSAAIRSRKKAKEAARSSEGRDDRPSGMKAALQRQSAVASASKRAKSEQPKSEKPQKKGIAGLISGVVDRAIADTELLKKSWNTAREVGRGHERKVARAAGTAAGAIRGAGEIAYRAGHEFGKSEAGQKLKKNLGKAALATAGAAGAGLGSLAAGKSPAAAAGRAAGTFVRRMREDFEFVDDLSDNELTKIMEELLYEEHFTLNECLDVLDETLLFEARVTSSDDRRGSGSSRVTRGHETERREKTTKERQSKVRIGRISQAASRAAENLRSTEGKPLTKLASKLSSAKEKLKTGLKGLIGNIKGEVTGETARKAKAKKTGMRLRTAARRQASREYARQAFENPGTTYRNLGAGRKEAASSGGSILSRGGNIGNEPSTAGKLLPPWGKTKTGKDLTASQRNTQIASKNRRLANVKEDFDYLASIILEDLINEGYANDYSSALDVLESFSDYEIGEIAESYLIEDLDIFDLVLEYLISEGFADTNEDALIIMTNMSEEWKESIVEGGFNSSGRYDVGGGRTVGPVAGAVHSLFSGNLPKQRTYVPPSSQKATNKPPAVPASRGDSGKLTDFGAGGGKAKLKTGMSVGQVERQGRMNKGDYSG